MIDCSPEIITISHDDYHAKYVGQTHDKKQFFLTNPFIPKMGGNPGREFLALYIFDANGNLIEAKIDDLGVRESNILPGQKLDIGFADSIVQNWLVELGEFSFCAINVAPFSLKRFGVEFGLIVQSPEESDDEDCCVTVEPGDYMCFYPPWDGDYDT
jgi:hypothetical protein